MIASSTSLVSHSYDTPPEGCQRPAPGTGIWHQKLFIRGSIPRVDSDPVEPI